MSRGITLIVPTYNEEHFIERCLESVIDDPHTEVLVIDGGSTDRTREVVRSLQTRFPGLSLVDNPKRTAACAMNIGVARATGDYLLRLDAHSVYPVGYVRRLVEALEEHAADVSGGVWIPKARNGNAFGRAVAASLVNPWVMGATDFRVGGGEVRQVDTVPFGCWRTERLRLAGGYNEQLHRSQDYDLAQRLRQQGAKIILVPDVRIEYQARSGFVENIRYNFWNGFWVGYPLIAHRVRFARRHLVAAAACLVGLLLLGAVAASASWWPLALAAPYLILLLMSALASSRDGVAVALQLPLITLGTHVLYGFGTLYGLVKGAGYRVWRRPSRPV